MAESNVDGTEIVPVTITNNENRGPRYVHSARGMEVIAAGGTLETFMSAAQIAATERAVIDDAVDAEMFTVITGDDVKPAKPMGKMTIAQLRALAEAEGVQLTGRLDGEGKALPDLATKDEIIAAIEAAREPR